MKAVVGRKPMNDQMEHRKTDLKDTRESIEKLVTIAKSIVAAIEAFFKTYESCVQAKQTKEK